MTGRGWWLHGPCFGAACLCICICLASSMCVWSHQGRRWMSLTALIGRAVSSCQVGSSGNIHTVRVCLCHHAMSQHKDRLGSSLCQQSVWGHACLPPSFSIPFFSYSNLDTHRLSLTEGVRRREICYAGVGGNSVLWASTFSSRNTLQNYCKTFIRLFQPQMGFLG